MQAHPIRRQAIRRRGLAEARSAEAVAPERGVRGTYKLSPERRAKGGLGCPVSHPEHGDTLSEQHRPVGKETGETAHIERWNNTLRQHLSRFVRKTLSFSKCVKMHEICLKLFLHRYNTELLPVVG